jgi:cell division protein FtsZ
MVKEGLINLDFADVRTVMREMGKAMMGTGEAAGEKRATIAAEAAISNPLLDETSMRGAKGLLISITGGQDLTLYEVDEAASRIREEVDADANIILGATFDHSLDGIVRVSVVATGIDGTAKETAARFSAASVAGRMAVARAFDTGHAPQRTPHSYREPAPAPLQPIHHDDHTDYDQETAIDDVTLRPLPPRPSFFEPMQEDGHVEAHEEEPIRPFLPPRPERAGGRTPRMPRVDELPIPAQNEIRASRGEPAEHNAIERKRMTLLQRLAQVGLGRREEAAPEYEPHHLAPLSRQEDEPMEREYRPAPERRTQEQVSEYTRRPAGRPTPTDSQSRNGRARVDEDELEIPAFLRRQAT